MSAHPDTVLERLRAYAAGAIDAKFPTPALVGHFLALFDHQQAQLGALRALKTPPAVDQTHAGETICQEADRLVSHDRQSQYGHPREDFTRTAIMWEALFDLPPGSLDPEKVAMAMICVKLSRLCNAYKRDTIVDIAGYAKTIDLCQQARPTNLVG